MMFSAPTGTQEMLIFVHSFVCSSIHLFVSHWSKASIFIILILALIFKKWVRNKSVSEHSESTQSTQREIIENHRAVREQSESTQSIKIRVGELEPKILHLVNLFFHKTLIFGPASTFSLKDDDLSIQHYWQNRPGPFVSHPSILSVTICKMMCPSVCGWFPLIIAVQWLI